MKRAIPELSIDTQVLERLFSAAATGEVVTFAMMTAAIGRDAQRFARGNIRTARLRLRKHHHMLFGSVVNVGLKRLDDAGKIGAARSHASRGRNQYRQARTSAASVDDFSKLPNHLKVEHNVIVAQSGALLHMTSAKSTRALEAKIGDGAQKFFKPKESLELMKANL